MRLGFPELKKTSTSNHNKGGVSTLLFFSHPLKLSHHLMNSFFFFFFFLKISPIPSFPSKFQCTTDSAFSRNVCGAA